MNRKLIQTVLAVLVASLLLTAPRAQQTTVSPAGEDRVALYQALLDLTNPWTVMCIAAHPDDEDGTSLIVMRRKYGAHTVSLFSTFGEGGQNAIGPELYEELGAIRARETMAAAEIQGSEPHFLGLKDFGYSKSADEAFRFWGHEEALRRMVLEIRRLRPDVIITNHSVTNNDHGHHQATARLELEAFDAATDPKRFPEQLKDGVTTWQVERLFVRVGRSNQAQADSGAVVTIDPNEQDPIRNTSFAEEALEALQKHATQGPWPKTVAELAARFARNSTDGKLPVTRYVLTREAKGAGALAKGSRNFLDGLTLPEQTAKQLAPTLIDGRPLTEFVDQRAKVIAALDTERHGRISVNGAEADFHRFDLFSARLNRALGLATRVVLKVAPPSSVVTPGSSTTLTFKLSNSGSQPAGLFGCAASVPPARTATDVKKSVNVAIHSDPINTGSSIERSQRIQIPANASINLPLSRHLYDASIDGLKVAASCTISVSKNLFKLEVPTHLDVAAPIEIDNISPSPIVRTRAITKGARSTQTADCAFPDFDYSLRVTNNQDVPFEGQIVVGPLSGRTRGSSVMVAAHSTANVTLIVPGCNVGRTQADPIAFSVLSKKGQPSAGIDVPVVWADARVAPNLHIGYLRGFDFSLPNALNSLGVESKELSVDDVRTGDLRKYSTIIVDNRVYESTPGLIAANQKLLDYANAGGTLIVFYHKSFEWNPDERRQRPQLAPYKLILGDERITDENAAITFLEPQHPLLNFPNKIGQEDFAGWIQERGLYYPKEWDPQFHALLQSNDPGETPLKGGLLVADYGRGRYIYTSMVWYRELRAGVPGAYRMLANMISYGHAK
ncbi:MAG: hypothetical protein QOH70_1489 [Blastocatellia bacterium]|jgi:LmbE family N-acetylglucosaminyl deacetylase|nr:hypothetical protein [Blastocatellia bacterium]